MQTITTIGFDIAKSVFQVHGVDAGGQVVIRRQLKRRYVLAFFQKLSPCLVGIEACASAHHWSRELQALGHTVRLIPPAYVKPYVKRQKNDAADAEAICEAVTRPNMRFVPTTLYGVMTFSYELGRPLPKAKSREKLAGLQGRAGEQQGAKEAGCRDHGTRPDHNLFVRSGLPAKGDAVFV